MARKETLKENTAEVAFKPSTVALEKTTTTPRVTLMLLSLKGPLTCRHLLNDITLLMPEHIATDTKLKERFTLAEVSEIADMKDANNVFLIETRKKSPAPLLWLVTREEDPATKQVTHEVMKFMMTGVYTMKELKFPGNPLSNTQMTTMFSAEFESSVGLRKAKSILTKIFNTSSAPVAEPATSKDYVDKIASFFFLEKQIMVRFYHIAKNTAETEAILAERRRKEEEKRQVQTEEEKADEAEKEKEADETVDPNIALIGEQKPWFEVNEVGPRFTLHPRETDMDDNYKDPEE
ncbi:ribosome biogenesis protein BRX1 [Nematocida displodere]|uniref:Ribosome biogenesis protein BRX1 n=1 Tax=Nematocida displodere TaxID=1805483 RepID=A0A177EDA9_9MICR|nr:ribosome biogenesis protein BRX1 [Nematocida displodere]